MVDWPSVTIGDVGTVFDGPHATPKTVDSGPIFLGIGALQNGRINLGETRHVTPDDFKTWTKRVKPQEDDVVFSYETRLGEAAIIPKGLECCLGRRMGLVRLKRDLMDPRFFLYVYISPKYQAFLRAKTIQGATVDRIALTEFPSFPLPLPPLIEQQAIASILGDLDDKIELNRRMNETLEAMARALFKDWFVDFGPTRAKQEGMAPYLPSELWDLFPERLDGDGRPEGWRIAAIGDLCRRIAMGPFGSDIKKDNFIDSGVPVVRGSNLTKGFVEDSFVFVSEVKANQLRNANAFPGDIVITHRGTLGQVGLIPEGSLFPRYVVSQSQMLLAVNQDVSTSRYIYEFLLSPMGQHALLANTSQTGVPAIARPTASVRAIKIIVPPAELLQYFDVLVAPLYKLRHHRINESRTLAQTRDLLLPKLMSGEIRVKDAEKTMEAHL